MSCITIQEEEVVTLSPYLEEFLTSLQGTGGSGGEDEQPCQVLIVDPESQQERTCGQVQVSTCEQCEKGICQSHTYYAGGQMRQESGHSLRILCPHCYYQYVLSTCSTL